MIAYELLFYQYAANMMQKPQCSQTKAKPEDTRVRGKGTTTAVLTRIRKTGWKITTSPFILNGAPNENRTRVSALKGPRPNL